jgi:hypothetical protein
MSSIESPSTNHSNCSRYLNELEREALDLSTTSHNRSLNDCTLLVHVMTNADDNHSMFLAYCRSPIMLTNGINETVAELRSRPYQMAHVRSATSHTGSTTADDDNRKSDYKRIINGSTGTGSTNQHGISTATIVRTHVLDVDSFVQVEYEYRSIVFSSTCKN